MRSELSQTAAEYKKAESIRQERDDKIKALLEEITQLLMKDELNQDIGKIKADRIRESIEHESLLSQLEYVHKYLQDIETNNDAGEDEGSTVHNLSSDQKTEVKNTIQMMESCAKNIRDHVAQFQNLNQLFGKLKSSQDESLKLFEADIDKLSSLKVHEFRNKLVQVHSWLVQISDEYYANKIDNFQKETGSANFKQIQRLLSTLNALNEIQPLPDVRVNSSNKKPISPCRLPDSLSDEVMDNMNAKLQKVMSMYESLMSTQK
ncbi:uncharacterized protein LOC103511658 isoform X1 [Diaphorina citri]|uniref:Uncharacterized protein LOC103511658 isoform X1 n=1 Tax=Diaphorina citri TaxID=121845 RepID=A0A3Q0IY42_DIACI|nr:uncharacterized protein LOC103511658 isoform X1 [Diaphorina citri]